jgi:hypothetical protein
MTSWYVISGNDLIPWERCLQESPLPVVSLSSISGTLGQLLSETHQMENSRNKQFISLSCALLRPRLGCIAGLHHSAVCRSPWPHQASAIHLTSRRYALCHRTSSQRLSPAQDIWGRKKPHSHNLFFFAVLGFELKASHLLGRCSITWSTHPRLFALVFFQIMSCFYTQMA